MVRPPDPSLFPRVKVVELGGGMSHPSVLYASQMQAHDRARCEGLTKLHRRDASVRRIEA